MWTKHKIFLSLLIQNSNGAFLSTHNLSSLWAQWIIYVKCLGHKSETGNGSEHCHFIPGLDPVCVVNGMSENLWDFFAHKSQSSLKTTHRMENKKGPKKRHWHYCSFLPACWLSLTQTHTDIVLNVFSREKHTDICCLGHHYSITST